MSTEVKVAGTLRFASAAAIDEAFEALDDGGDGDDAIAAEISSAVGAHTVRDGLSLRFALDIQLSSSANLELQDWLEDLAAAAIDGHIDIWLEDFGDSMFVRLAAGGNEREIPGPWPG